MEKLVTGYVNETQDFIQMMVHKLSAFPLEIQGLTTQLKAVSTVLDHITVAQESGKAIHLMATAYYVVMLKNFLYDFYIGSMSHWLARREINDADLVTAKIVASKLDTVSDYGEAAMTLPQDDLLFYPRTHERWQALDAVITIIPAEADTKAQFEKFEKLVAVGNAFMSRGHGYKRAGVRLALTPLWGAYYTLAKKDALVQAENFYAAPDARVARLVWNLMDSMLGSTVYDLSLPSIRTSEVVFIPRLWVGSEEETQVEPSASSGIVPHVHYTTTLNEEVGLLCTDYTRQRDPGGHRIPIRVITSLRLQRLHFNFSLLRYLWQKPQTYNCAQPQICDSVIIHFHGGGFISMSGTSHQAYLRKWAIMTNTPIISVDYRLAPEHQYPAAIDDAWQAYHWVVNYAQTNLGIRPGRVILTGDSAGGNIAIGVTMRAIELNDRIPDGLLLVYPAVSLDVTKFSPSYMISLHNYIVPHSFLKLCLQAYLGENSTADPSTDPYISPILASDAILAQFPVTRIMFGSDDPLYDDCYRFSERLLKLGVDIKGTMYEDFMHGFLSFDMPGVGLKCAEKSGVQGAEYLKELLEYQPTD